MTAPRLVLIANDVVPGMGLPVAAPGLLLDPAVATAPLARMARRLLAAG